MTDYTTCKLRDGTYLVVRTIDLATGHYHEVANVVGQTMAERIAKLLNRDQMMGDLEARIQAEDDLPAEMDRTCTEDKSVLAAEWAWKL